MYIFFAIIQYNLDTHNVHTHFYEHAYANPTPKLPKTFSEAGKTSFVELGRRPNPVFLQPEIELPQMHFKTGHTTTCPAKCFSRDGLGLHPSLRKKFMRRLMTMILPESLFPVKITTSIIDTYRHVGIYASVVFS